MENTGLIFIPDISGFTKFIQEVEISHSRLIIQELLETLINANQIGLEISEIEGDAILFYKFGQPPPLQEIYQQVEVMFSDFHLAKKDQNEIAVIICLSGFALCEVMEKNADAKHYLRESILLSQGLHFYEALAWSMEIWALASINDNNFIHAVTLMGAVDHLRNSTHLPVWEDLQAIMMDAKAKIEEQMPVEVFRAAWNHGASLSLDKMVTYAMSEEDNQRVSPMGHAMESVMAA